MLKSSLNITNTVNENVIMSKAIINNHESHSKKKVYIYVDENHQYRHYNHNMLMIIIEHFRQGHAAPAQSQCGIRKG